MLIQTVLNSLHAPALGAEGYVATDAGRNVIEVVVVSRLLSHSEVVNHGVASVASLLTQRTNLAGKVEDGRRLVMLSRAVEAGPRRTYAPLTY